MKRITVLLAEDHQIVREGFRSLLKHERDIKVVGEAETGRQAVAMVKELRPAVVVMDIAMPLLNGLGSHPANSQRLSRHQSAHSLRHSDDAYVEQVTVLGAAGFLLKLNLLAQSGHGNSRGPQRKHIFQPHYFQARAGSSSKVA